MRIVWFHASDFSSHPLCCMVEHFLPGGVELAAVLLQESLLGQGDGLLGGSQNLHRPLKLLSGLLGFNLSLQIQKGQKKLYCLIVDKTT